MVYVKANGIFNGERTMALVDRAGSETPLPLNPRRYQQGRFSAAGSRVALDVRDQDVDIWIADVTRWVQSRPTFSAATDYFPVWTEDGRNVIFSSNRDGGVLNLFIQPADGSGEARRLTTSPNLEVPTAATPDGKSVVFYEVMPTTGRDIMLLSLDTHMVRPLIQTRFEERFADVSRDGKWIAYESNSSGAFEIVKPFPNVADGQWQVSNGGGTQPKWSQDGRELFFVGADGALTVAGVATTGTTFSTDAPHRILEPRYWSAGPDRTYDVSPDGKRFLMNKQSGADQGPAPPAGPDHQSNSAGTGTVPLMCPDETGKAFQPSCVQRGSFGAGAYSAHATWPRMDQYKPRADGGCGRTSNSLW